MFTWKRTTAKSLIVIMLIAMLPFFSNLSLSYSESYATGVSNVSVNGSPEINEGDEFTLNIVLNGDAQRLLIEDTTNFKTVDGVTNFTNQNASGSRLWSIRLISVGKENDLKIKVFPIVGTDALTFQDSVSIPGFKKSVNTAPVATDIFKVSSASVRDVIAGSTTTLEIPIEVLNKTAIKNVTATIISPKDDTLFSSDRSDYTATILEVSKASPATARFSVAINPSAKSKVHEIKLQLKYMSPSGTIYTDETSNSYFVRVKSNNMEPSLNVVDYQLPNTPIKAGEKQKLSLVIENAGTITANDIRVKLSGFDKDKIQLAGDTDTKAIYVLGGKEKETIYYNISASKTAKSESNELVADISYIDDNGKEYKNTSKVYLIVDGKDVGSIQLDVLNLIVPSRVKAKAPFSIEFDLKNVSQTDAKMLEVGIEYPNATMIPKSTPKKTVRLFKVGQQQHFKFDFISKDDAQTGFYDLYVALKYNIEGGKETEALTYKEFAGVLVDGAIGLGRPKVIIENYDFGGMTVLSGQEFDLSLELFNTSSEELIKNIKVSLKADDGVFIPVDMSSSFFIEKIDSQEHVNKIIRLKTKSDATVKAYNLAVTFQYEDSKGNAYDIQKNPYKEEELISIPVNQPIRIEAGEVTLNPENYLNQPTPVSMEFFNMGRSIVYNLMVKAEGDFQIQGGNYFVGNFEAGRSDFFETQVVPTVEGEAKGKIIFQFEDANGEPGTYEKEFKMTVMSAPVDPNTTGEGGEGTTPVDPNAGGEVTPMANGKLVIYGILTGISALFGGVYMWKRRLEKMRLLKSEDDDE